MRFLEPIVRGLSGFFKVSFTGSIGLCIQMSVVNIWGLYDRAESSENSLSPAKPA